MKLTRKLSTPEDRHREFVNHQRWSALVYQTH
jgi:hypothetical protein